MKLAVLALTLASISFAALAGPPGPPVTYPLDVNVVNQPIAVSTIPAITPKTEFFVWGKSDFGQLVLGSYEFEFPVLLTGVAVQLQMSPGIGPTDKCELWINHNWMDGPTKMGRRLAALSVLTNTGPVATYVPLPNIYADIGDLLVLSATTPSGEGTGSCLVEAYVYGVNAD